MQRWLHAAPGAGSGNGTPCPAQPECECAVPTTTSPAPAAVEVHAAEETLTDIIAITIGVCLGFLGALLVALCRSRRRPTSPVQSILVGELNWDETPAVVHAAAVASSSRGKGNKISPRESHEGLPSRSSKVGGGSSSGRSSSSSRSSEQSDV